MGDPFETPPPPSLDVRGLNKVTIDLYCNDLDVAEYCVKGEKNIGLPNIPNFFI